MMRVAVVGAGRLGRRHARVLQELDAARLAAVVDWAPDTAAKVAGEHGVPWFVSLEAMLEEVPCDAIVVATPDFLHCQPVMRALVHGRHVLVERPLSTTVEEGRAMVDEAMRRRLVLKVNYTQRFVPEFVWMKDQIDHGVIGTPLMVVSVMHDRIGIPTRLLSWAAQTSPVFFLSSMDLDLIGWFLESEATRVVAQERRGLLERRGVRVADGIDALITYGCGAVANVHSSWIHPESWPSVASDRITVIGEEGAIHYESRGRSAECYAETGGRQVTFTGPHTADELGGRLHGGFRRSLEDFVVCSRTGIEPESSARRTLHVTQTQVAILESIETAASIAVGTLRGAPAR